MTFDEIWAALLRKDASLANDEAKVEFRAVALKRLLRQAYDQGVLNARKESSGGSSASLDVMERLFGALGGGK